MDYIKLKKDTNLRIWAWKGDYLSFGAGAEMGIYKENDIPNSVPTHLVDDKYRLHMKLSVWYKKEKKKIGWYNPHEKTW